MAKKPLMNPFLELLRDAFVGMVRSNAPDLSSRGLAIFLICCEDASGKDSAPTVRALAAQMDVSKPSVTRSVDRLEALGLVRRKPDPADRRSVLVTLTPAGHAFRRRLAKMLATAMPAA